MLIEIFIIFQILTIGLFLLSFFTHNEILWAVTALFSGFMMLTSFNVEKYVMQFDTSINAYVTLTVTNSYPYLMGINMLFLVLTLALGLYDLFDKYGTTSNPNFKSEQEEF